MTKKINANYGSDEPNWGLFYRENTKDLGVRKSIKVKLPLRQHIKLHALKLFTEKNISETVEKALDAYFAEMKTPEGMAGGPGMPELGAKLGDMVVDIDIGGDE